MVSPQMVTGTHNWEKNGFLTKILGHACDSPEGKKGIPVTIWGIPARFWAGSDKNNHMGSPHNYKEFVTIWGLTYTHVVAWSIPEIHRFTRQIVSKV